MAGILEVLASLLYPPACALCGREQRCPGPPRLCGPCRASLGRVEKSCSRCAQPVDDDPCIGCLVDPPPYATTFAAFTYSANPGAQRAIWHWKMGRNHLLGRALARRFATAIPASLAYCNFVVPIPGGHLRRAWRGFETASVLSREVVRAHPGVALADNALRRRYLISFRNRDRSRAERQKEAESVYRLGRRRLPTDSSVLLVDDVMTSQASARTCARLLLHAGAARVDVAVLARTPALRPDRGPTTGSEVAETSAPSLEF